MNWSRPKHICGNRVCIESNCGQYAITRNQDKDDEYVLIKLTGAAWRDLGIYTNADEAKAAAAEFKQRGRK